MSHVPLIGSKPLLLLPDLRTVEGVEEKVDTADLYVGKKQGTRGVGPRPCAGGGENILVLNSGSSSIKFKVIDSSGAEVASGLLEPLQNDKKKEGATTLKLSAAGEHHTITFPLVTAPEGLELILKNLTDLEVGGVDLESIGAVGHRVVHGGRFFTEPALIDDCVENAIKECVPLAPLHNPANLLGIQVAKQLLPGVPQVAVFDTAMHATMPAYAFRYGFEGDVETKSKARRYGFHGISVEHSVKRAGEVLGVRENLLNAVVCHLGNGASITAILGGKSFENTMGMTPSAGILMGTRGGLDDPGMLLYLKRQMQLSDHELDNLINKKSGLKGFAGTNDVRELLEREANGDRSAALALAVYVYKVAKQIGAYMMALDFPSHYGRDPLAEAKANGGQRHRDDTEVHAVVFTGGVGENSDEIRERVLECVAVLRGGVDWQKNHDVGTRDADVSRTDYDGPHALVIHANEEGVIADHTREIVEALVGES